MFDLYLARRRKRKLIKEYARSVGRLQASGASREAFNAREANHQQALRAVELQIALFDSNRPAWARHSFKVIALRIIYVGLAAYVAFLIYGYVREATKSKTVTISTYTENICDDPEKTEDHTRGNQNPASFSVVLKEGCFSGFVELPSVWQHWRTQFRGAKDENEWVSQWWRGDIHPHPIQTYAILTADPGNFIVPSNEVRLQGRGTLMFYRVAEWPNQPNSTGKAHPPAVAPNVPPIPKEVGPPVEKMSGSIRFGFYHCLVVADTVLCRGYAKSEYNVKRNFGIYSQGTYLTDGAGNRYPATQMSLAGGTCTSCYDEIFPGTAVAFSITFKGVPNISTATLIFKHIGFEGDQVTQTDVTIDK